MKTTVSRYDFERAFVDADRKENFSYEGLKALFDYFESYEEETGEEIELDVIAICCEYCEDTVAEIARNYPIDLNDADPESDDYEDQCRQIVFDYLSDHTSVVGDTATGFVYACF
jgi:tRNA splicing ligase